eukprot:2308071-Pyramimonas_sp.AAC.1
MDQALDLMRRMPPVNVQQNLGALLDLAPELTEELLSRVDQPLQTRPSPTPCTRLGSPVKVVNFLRQRTVRTREPLPHAPPTRVIFLLDQAGIKKNTVVILTCKASLLVSLPLGGLASHFGALITLRIPSSGV